MRVSQKRNFIECLMSLEIVRQCQKKRDSSFVYILTSLSLLIIHFDDSIPISDSFNSAQIYPMEFFFVVTEKKGIVELTSKGTKMKQML